VRFCDEDGAAIGASKAGEVMSVDIATLDMRLERAFAPVEQAITAGRIPGAVLGVADRTGQQAVRFAGHATLVPERTAIARHTVFDLASLTKVIFTTTRILELVAEGKLGLDRPIAAVLPDLRQYDVAGAPERGLTVRQLLSHQTFLPPVEPLYTLGLDQATLKAHVLQKPWQAGSPVYSDINFILLGIMIERLTGKPLADQPLDAGFTFRPDPETCAATERCQWRGRVLRGEVHDENAHALGGAAGHAGLFGTIDAVLSFGRGILDGSRIPEAVAPLVFAAESEKRTLGWERRHNNWPGGEGASPRAIGHTGFTGTGLWLDPSSGLVWSLLTNRVHPTRHADSGIVALRKAVGLALFSP
jgi:CubicO group peptidase (beta-lactamase class C family)